MLKRKALISATSALCLSLGVGACGGTSHQSASTATNSSATQPKQSPGTPLAQSPNNVPLSKVVAHVGSTPITFATVEHQMALESEGTPLPDAPAYSACIKRLKALAAGTKTPPAERTEAKLKQNCNQRYGELLQEALNIVIHRHWLAGEASELGISVSPAEVSEEFNASKKLFKSEAEFASYRKKVGESIPDILAQAKLNKLTEKLFKGIEAKEHLPTSADVVRYYNTHRQQFLIPKGRAVRIVRTATRVSAAKVGKELQGGKSFADVAKELSAIGQPLGAKNGQETDLKPGYFEEKKLNDAIFNAKLDRLYGPIQLIAYHKTIAPETNTGFFFFEVTKVTPGGQTPLSSVKAGLAEALAKAEKERVFPAFVLPYRRKWKARTDCKAGFIVQYCKQYKGSKAQEEVDPYTL